MLKSILYMQLLQLLNVLSKTSKYVLTYYLVISKVHREINVLDCISLITFTTNSRAKIPNNLEYIELTYWVYLNVNTQTYSYIDQIFIVNVHRNDYHTLYDIQYLNNLCKTIGASYIVRKGFTIRLLYVIVVKKRANMTD